MEVGQRLSEARQNQNLTQQVVADKLHVTRQTISSWGNSRSYPDIVSLIAVSDLYGLSLDQLLKEDDKMMDDMKKKQEELKRAKLVNWGLYAVYAILLLLLTVGSLFSGFELETGPGVLVLIALGIICWMIFITSGHYRQLKGKPDSYSKKMALVICSSV